MKFRSVLICLILSAASAPAAAQESTTDDEASAIAKGVAASAGEIAGDEPDDDESPEGATEDEEPGDDEPNAERSDEEEPEAQADPPAVETPELAPEVREREADMFGGSTPASDREAEMFGGDEETPLPESGPAQTRDERVLSGDVMTQSTIEDRLAEKQDPLAIGGLMYLRMQYDVREEGDPEEFALRAPNLLDVYLDARPNDRVRGFARGRLNYDYTVDEDATNPLTGEPQQKTSVALDQLWLKFDIARAVFVTAGKQRIKWGSGRFWNPTDFLNNERLDPLSVTTFDERLGVTLLKAHIPVEALGWNFYAIATLDEASSPQDVGGALRGEFLVGLTEIALSGAVRRNNPYRLGADLSTGLGPFDLHVEGAVFYGDERPFYRGDFEFPATFPEEYSREDEWIPQVSGGAEVGIRYSDEDTMYLGAEYFYNGAGYDDATLYPWLIAQGRFTPFYLGRHYAGAYSLLPGPGQWDDTSFVLSGFGNLSDRSFLVRFDYNVTVLTYLSFNAFSSVAFGENGEFNFGLELPAIGEFPGVDLAQPLFDVGVGLRISI